MCFQLPHGVDVTLAELQEMAMRQQQQIEAQQQMLVAKEQRLKFLKQQELRHQQVRFIFCSESHDGEKLQKKKKKPNKQRETPA